MGSTSMRQGHVYILTSPNSEFIKIGGTDFAPIKRIREINACDPYRSHGPWGLFDFRQVSDWRAAEAHMHYAFRSALTLDPPGQRELFSVAPLVARKQLEAIDPELIVSRPKIDRLFQDAELSGFLSRLFSFGGLWNWLDCQGAWTFVLFPSTGRGRYYTLNIGSHEVAFATFEKIGEGSYHSLVMDSLIHDFPSVVKWVARHHGELRDGLYTTALPRSTSVSFTGSFDDALEFLELDGVRRALLAYWSEGLTTLKERGVSSTYARYHHWNAVSALMNRQLSGSGSER